MAGYLSGSLTLLAARPVPDDAAIHDVRVLMKKHRAAIRLVKPLLDEDVFRREYLDGRGDRTHPCPVAGVSRAAQDDEGPEKG
jgi:hypothetical protein